MLLALALSGVTAIPLPVPGATWIVDDDGGPGVDFTNLQAAFDAASRHDVILVRPGTYTSATLRVGARVLGESDPLVSGELTVEALPAQDLAVVAGFRTFFTATGCSGTVVADDMDCFAFTLTNSADVRIHANRRLASLRIEGARVEAVECDFLGAPGPNQHCGFPPDPTGDSASYVWPGSALHAARCSFTGGNGGNSSCPDLGQVEPGGTGGHGIYAWGAGTRVLVTGSTAHVLDGGAGGTGLYGVEPGGAGIFVAVGASARVSGVILQGSQVQQGGTLDVPSIADPTLRLLEQAAPGSNLTFRIVAPPGSQARIALGSIPVVVPSGTGQEDVLVTRARVIDLGVVPAQGILGWNYQVPATWPVGTTVFAQATLTYPGGETRRTSSVPVVVR